MDLNSENRTPPEPSAAVPEKDEALQSLEAMIPDPLPHFEDDLPDAGEAEEMERAVVFDEALAERKAARERAPRASRTPRTERRGTPLPEREELSFTSSAVLDESFAERKAARTAPDAEKPARQSKFTVTLADDLLGVDPGQPETAPRPEAPRQARPVRRADSPSRSASARRSLPPAAPARTVKRAHVYASLSGRKPTWADKLLYSGETVSTASSRILRQAAALLLCLAVLAGILWVRNAATGFLIANDYSEIYEDDTYLDPVSVAFVSDPQTLPSGYAAAKAMGLQFGERTDGKLFKKSVGEDIFPDEVLACLKTALPDREVEMKTGMSNSDLLTSIHESLSEGLPVVVLLGEISGFHYGIVTDMNTQEDFLSVVDPESGIAARYSTEDFLEATLLQSYQNMPAPQKLAVAIGSWVKNTAIFVS